MLHSRLRFFLAIIASKVLTESLSIRCLIAHSTETGKVHLFCGFHIPGSQQNTVKFIGGGQRLKEVVVCGMRYMCKEISGC